MKKLNTIAINGEWYVLTDLPPHVDTSCSICDAADICKRTVANICEAFNVCPCSHYMVKIKDPITSPTLLIKATE